ncbi:MAG: polysaccharide biosynthesis tyrosine autokinase [Chthoniobacteraceae bacterium]
MPDTGEVQLHFLDYWRVVKNRWGIITLTFLLVVVTASITIYFLPREYYSKVMMEVEADNYKIGIFDNDKFNPGTDGKFVPTQFTILQSKEMLYPVIDELRLGEKWAVGTTLLPKEQIYFRLLPMLDVKEVRNTNLLEIGVFSTDPQEAANIANTIAVQYRKRRIEDNEKMFNLNLSELKEEVEKQRQKVELAHAEVIKLQQSNTDLTDSDPDLSPTATLKETQALSTARAQENDAQTRVGELSTQLDQISKMTPDELISSLSLLNIVDPTVSKILPLYQDTKAEEVTLVNSGLGENHPKLKILRAQKDVYRKQLDAQIETLRKNLASRLNMAQIDLDDHKKNVKDLEAKFRDSKAGSQEYIEKKDDYAQQKRLLDSAETRYATQKMEMQISFQPAKIWEKAERADVFSKPKVSWLMGGAAIFGVVWGIGLAFFLEYLDTSVKTLADVEKFIGVSVLAVVPKIEGLLHQMEGRSPDAETYRTLRTNIEFHKPTPDANTITIISGGPGEGKSTTLCNLAATFANAGSNVLIVDADLRRPSQAKFFDMDGTVGLVNYVNGEIEFEDAIRPTPVENIWIIPSGPLPKDPVAILNSHRMVELIGRAKAQFDFVLFDSPPILGLSDGAVLSSVVEMTVMVVQHRRFPRASLLRVKQAVLNVGGNLTGVVLNKVDTRDDQNYYYYTSYYDYYSPTERNKKTQEKAETEI